MTPSLFRVVAANAGVQAVLGSDPMRFYPFGKVDSADDPYAVWQVVGGNPIDNLAGTPSMDMFAIQVDVYSNESAEVFAVAQALRAAIEPYAHITSFDGESRDPRTKRYRYRFSVDWFECDEYLGPELIAFPDFSSASGWSSEGGFFAVSFSTSAGYVTIQGGFGDAAITYNTPFTPGKTFRAEVVAEPFSNTGCIVSMGSSATAQPDIEDAGTYRYDITADSTGILRLDCTDFRNARISRVSVKQIL